MKILLISPPTESAVKKIMGVTSPPLNLAYLASMIRNEHEVKIVDSIAEELKFEDLKKAVQRRKTNVKNWN